MMSSSKTKIVRLVSFGDDQGIKDRLLSRGYLLNDRFRLIGIAREDGCVKVESIYGEGGFSIFPEKLFLYEGMHMQTGFRQAIRRSYPDLTF